VKKIIGAIFVILTIPLFLFVILVIPAYLADMLIKYGEWLHWTFVWATFVVIVGLVTKGFWNNVSDWFDKKFDIKLF